MLSLFPRFEETFNLSISCRKSQPSKLASFSDEQHLLSFFRFSLPSLLVVPRRAMGSKQSSLYVSSIDVLIRLTPIEFGIR